MGQAEGQERNGKGIRAFFALSLPEPVRDALGDWQGRALSRWPALRPVQPASLHLTLAFLGDLDPGEIERARLALGAIEPRGIEIRLRPTPIWLPPRRPGVLAFEVAGPALGELREELAARLVEDGLLAPGGRPFRPHLTVARVRGGRSRSRDRPSPEELPWLPVAASGPIDAVRVALYRSELRTQGSRYSSLADIDLPPAGGG